MGPTKEKKSPLILKWSGVEIRAVDSACFKYEGSLQPMTGYLKMYENPQAVPGGQAGVRKETIL